MMIKKVTSLNKSTCLVDEADQYINTIAQKVRGKKVVVVDDFFLDKYIYIKDEETGVSLYTGKSAYVIDHTETSPGAAGTVAKNLALLGVGDVYAVGFCGNDGDGYTLMQNMKAMKINTDKVLVLDDRSTPCYTMIMRDSGKGYVEDGEVSVQNHKLTTSEMEQKLIHNLSTLIGEVQPDAVIFLDQLDYENYGVITTGMRRYIEKIHSEFPAVLTYVDSRQFIGDVAHTAIRKCNNFEFARAYSTDASNMTDLCEQLTNISDTPLIVTLGADGTLISKHGAVTIVPSFSVGDTIDTRGAGDAFTTGYVTSRICGVGEYESVLIGNAVAACCVSQIATTGRIKMQELETMLRTCIDEIER